MAQESALLNVMIGAARKAARGLVRDFGEVENLQVSRKGPADFVSAADRKAERIVCAELKKARPHYGILSEESGFAPGKDTSNRWIVDPLDGTTNFLHGLPQFAVSIGLERDAELIAGVVYAPVLDQLFTAEKGKGAHLNGNRLRVSARRNIADALFATGIPFKGIMDERDRARVLREIGAVMAVSAGVRRFGSATLDLAYVAAGRFEGFWETGLSAWDMAAGIVLVREAGGFVSEIDGRDGMMTNRNILAANDSLHAELGKILRAAATEKP